MVLTIANNLNVPPVVFYALQGTVLVGVGFYIAKRVKKWKRDQIKQNYPKDVVILHQFPRGLRAPNPSPFPLKLETWYAKKLVFLY